MKVLIGYSSIFGTSTSYAEKLQKDLDKLNIDCLCYPVDSYGNEWIKNFQGTLILLLSTTGDGECPQNAIKFYETLKLYQAQGKRLNQINFAVLGFGSSLYPKFCAFAKQINSLLKKLGGVQITEIKYCDSNLKVYQSEPNKLKTIEIFNAWKKQIILKINENNEKQNSVGGTPQGLTPQMLKLFETKKMKKLDKKFAAKINLINSIDEYKKLPSSKVLEINQLRQRSESGPEESKRSTLHIRLQNSSQVVLTPGCVINIYPENKLNGLKIQSNIQENNALINETLKRVKLDQLASRELINIVFNEEQNFKDMTREEKLVKYKQCIMNKKLTVRNLIDQFKPKELTFYSKLKLQPPRPYSLCSWHADQSQIELCVSIVPNGVTTNYLKSHPESVKLTVSSTAFKLPQNNKPIMMICNGTGIAPFRSITQCYAQKRNSSTEAPLEIFYGIQNVNVDYYFKNQWIEYQKKNLLAVKIAESRRNPEQREYVQNIINSDMIHNHLFNKEGLIFISGGSGMADDVQNIIREALRSQTKSQASVNQLYEELKEKSIIVEEVFH